MTSKPETEVEVWEFLCDESNGQPGDVAEWPELDGR